MVVSNRVPSPAREASAGGLAVGLREALEKSGGLWLGWDGRIAQAAARIAWTTPFTLATLSLNQAEYEGYYGGFSNRTLWPLMHGRLDMVHFDAEEFACYLAVNQRFADALLPLLEADDCIWVHDYHLIPLGALLRQQGVSSPLGLFLHGPVPAPEILEALPCYQQLIRSLNAYDLVGLQTEKDVRNLSDFMLRYLGGQRLADDSLMVGGHRVRIAAFPIGIDPQAFSQLALSQSMAAVSARVPLRIIGVERLDYTKGLPQRLQAFEHLLRHAPRYCGRLEFLQIAAPSRESVPEYRALRDELEAQSGRINARYASLDWIPMRYLNQLFDREHLAGLYRHSRVGLVTPLRDGMNLVAKEYVAAQDPLDPGVLILSRFAGAAERLQGALIVNPHDVGAVAAAIMRALDMPLSERRARWHQLMLEIETHDIHDWRHRFLKMLSQAHLERQQVESQKDSRCVPLASLSQHPLRPPMTASAK